MKSLNFCLFFVLSIFFKNIYLLFKCAINTKKNKKYNLYNRDLTMQTKLKNHKIKKTLRNKKTSIQRGGSGRHSTVSSHTSRRSKSHNNLNMPRAFQRLQLEVEDTKFAAKFPPVPKYIPNFNIRVRIEDLQELQKIFTVSPALEKLVESYKLMHLSVKDLDPKDIRSELSQANKVLDKMIELLKDTYIYTRSGNIETALQADKWCDYIKKLVESNQKNIREINEFLAI